MIIGKVIGNVWATRKEELLSGYKLLVITPIDYNTGALGMSFEAVDMVGAGTGEMVLIVQGSSARKALDAAEAPIDAAVVGIIDYVEINSSLEKGRDGKKNGADSKNM